MADHWSLLRNMSLAANPDRRRHHSPHLRNGEHEMIPNNDKHIYVILDANDTSRCYAPVVAWNDFGDPMILDEEGLTEATRGNFPGYAGVIVFEALHGVTHDGALGRYRVTVTRPAWEQPVWEN